MHRPCLRMLPRLRLSLGAALAWGAIAALPPAAPGGDEGSDGLLGFHRRDRDFRPVEIPEWVWEKTRIAFVTDDKIDLAARAGVEVVHTGAGWAYHPLVRDDPDSGLPEAEAKALRERVARVKAHGMRIVCGVPPFAPAELVKLHPEWLIHPDASDAIEAKASLDLTKPENYGYRLLCLNSPWGNYYRECLAEMMEEYGLDGYSFDGNYLPRICHCRFCERAYADATGRGLPSRADVRDLDYRVYMIWAGDRLEDWYRGTHERLRRVNPEAVLNSWTVNAGRWGHFLTSPRAMPRRMNLLYDCPMQEWWLDETNQGGSIVPAFGAAYIHAVTGHRVAACEPYLMSRGNPYGTDSFPRHEAVARSLLAITHGSLCAFSFGWPGHAETAVRVTEEIRRRSPWLVHAKRLPYAALLVSEQSRQFYGLDRIEERYLPHCFGAFRAAIEEHLPLDLITEWDLRPEALGRYRAVILPNSACLSSEQVQALREYVSSGGGLVASSETSLFDEIGRSRADFALGDVFGIRFEGRPEGSQERAELDANFAITIGEEYWRRRKGIATLRWGDDAGELFEDEKLQELVPGRSVTFKGPMVRVSSPEGPGKARASMLPRGEEGAYPAVITGTFGKGRWVYLAAGLDAGYYTYWYPYQRRILANAFRWAAGEPPPVEIRAPMCIQSTFFRQSDDRGGRILVHIYNDLATTSNHGSPDADIPLREESVPVAGIEIAFSGVEVDRFHLEPGGAELEPREEGGGRLVVELPPVDLHAILVAEVAP